MRLGMMVGEGSGFAPQLDGICERAAMIEQAGFDTAWIANIALDAMTAAALAGQATRRIEIGTAVVPTFTRHPAAMLQQAASTQMACSGRFSLGVGLAHQFMVEGMWGLSYEKPARHMRAYLEVLGPGLAGDAVRHRNDLYDVDLGVMATLEHPVPLLVAAMGPVMLRLAGEMTAGTITWATGVRTLQDHVVPRITRAADAAGRPGPRIVAGFPVLLTSNVDAAKAMAAEVFAIYAQVPSYRAMLDKEGVRGVEDIAIIGDERVLNARLAALEAAGVTDLCMFPFETEAGEIQRTIAFLASR